MCGGLVRTLTPDVRWLPDRRARVDFLERHRGLVRGCARCFPDEGNAPVVDVVKGVRVLLIGQAPGLTEVATRLPFTGPVGRRLDGCFSEAGLSRAQIYLSALARCLSGKPRGGGDKVPSRAMLADCRPHLLREFGLLRPEVVIPAGGWL
jgi:uracil-DNA glycosylase family 4